MQRDMDLVRKILLGMEAEPGGYASSNFTIEDYDGLTVGYHVWLMEQAGLITAVNVTAQQDDAPQAIPLSITWKGHEFVEAARQETIWNRAKAIVGRVGAASWPVWMEALNKAALERLTGP